MLAKKPLFFVFVLVLIFPFFLTAQAYAEPPVVSDIPGETIDEGVTFATFDLDDYVTDIDNSPAEINWTYSGNTQLTVAIDPTTHVATITAPDLDWNGTETVTFTATDPGLDTDSDDATFTVNAINDAPVLGDIPGETIDEGVTFATFDLDDYVTDIDNSPAEINWTYSGNTQLSVAIDPTTHVATITAPDLDWNGTETVTFTATDPGLDTDSDDATFTVNAINDAPVLGDIPGETIDEGVTFATFDLDDYVTDIDNTPAEINWTYSGNTQLSVAIDPTTHVATITAPDLDWNGTETVTFTATDPGLDTDSDDATFTVNAINDAPVLGDIPGETIDEGVTFATFDLDDYVTDIDNSPAEINWTYSGNTDLSVAIDPTTHVATITAPDLDWNGTETITFTATDPGLDTDSDDATFTVNAINDAPVLGDIPGETIDEGVTFATFDLDDYVTDIDNTPAEINWTYSGNTDLSVAIDPTTHVATITAPDLDWNGTETVTFTATDPGLDTDSDDATFTVNAINDAPVLGDIPGETIDEGVTFATFDLDDYVTDIDNSPAEINWTYSGNTDLSVAIDPTTHVATITAPDLDWNGTETVTFTATDPGLDTDSDDATFTVNAINDAPVLGDIPGETIDEGVTFATFDLDDYVTDIDNSPAEINWTYSGNTDLSVAIDPTTHVATITAPDLDWNGTETITFTATDPGLDTDSDDATFTVNAINDAPVLGDIPGETIDEGVTFATFDLDDYVTDIDNSPAEINWTYSGNTDLSVAIDPTTHVATITAPDLDWNGTETITFTATDPGLDTDSDDATFTVNAINDAPVLGDIPGETIDEGVTFATFDLDDYVTDIDNSPAEINWTYSGNTDLSVAIDPTTHVATITAPDLDWNGTETITFTATDPGLDTDSDDATFTVNAINDAPVLGDIPGETIDEGVTFATFDLDDYVTDIDNSPAEINWTYSGNTQLSVAIDPTTHVATITAPDLDWNGTETITFTATDPGLDTDSDDATFTVNAINDAPVLGDIPGETIDEGVTFATFDLDDYVTDIDNSPAEINWTYSGNTQLSVAIDPTTHVATITAPDLDWNGTETVTFTATDPGLDTDSDDATFTVNAINDAPVLGDIPGETIDEGVTFATFDLDDYVTDIDNSPAEINWTYSGNTDLSVAIDPTTHVATITAPDLDWNGTETITFTATDPGLDTDSDDATFTVNAINDAPVLGDIPGETIDEGVTFATFDLDDYVTDIDNSPAEINWTYSGNTQLSVAIDPTTHVATITAPDLDWNGTETITFTATDPGLDTDSDDATFTVNAINDAPVLGDIPGETIDEGVTFATFDLDDYVTDIDNSPAEINWTYSGNTQLSVAIDPTTHVATITAPDLDWNGTETITFTATDPGLDTDSDDATFTVNAINDAPVLGDIPGETIDEGVTFATFDLDDYVTDIDNSPAEINWTYSGNTDLSVAIDPTTHVATITAPDLDWNGTETITFTATDPGLDTDSDDATFTVNAINDAPVLGDIPGETIDEGVTFATFDLDDYVTDIDNSPAEINWTYSGNTDLSVAIDPTTHVATITAPDLDWNGTETITFTATDPGLDTDSDDATFTVNAINDAPVLGDIPGETIDEGVTFATFDLDDYVTDIDNSPAEINWTYSGNTDLSVAIDPTTHVATITAPDLDWNGTETITFTATDPGLDTDSDDATFTVNAINDAPVLGDIPGETIDEGVTFATFDLDDYVTDIDNSPAEINWTYSGNTDLSVAIDPTTHVATITAPDLDWNGTETITFTATDPGLDTDSDDATFTVTAVNDPPVANDDSATVVEGGTVSLLDSAEASVLANDIDVDGDTLTATLVSGPTLAADFNLNSDGTFIYTHDGTENFSDSFTYEIDDGNGETSQATVSITITPGVVGTAQSTVTVEPGSISADGAATTTITVTPKDVDGNSLGIGETVALATTSGTLLGTVIDVGDGTYTQQLQATALAGTATVTATVNSTVLATQPTVTFVDDIIPAVNSFAVADLDSGSSLYTNDQTVNVSMDEGDVGGTVAYWLITESAIPPSQADFESANITARPPTYTISGAEGMVNLYAWVMDDHNNISALSANSQATIEMDLTAPAIEISSPSDGAVLYPATQTVSGTISESSISTGTLSLNGDVRAISFSGGSFTESIVLDKGTNTIGVLAVDLAGNEGSTFITVMNDHDGDGTGDDVDEDDDNDGLPDTWEEDRGLDPYLDDAADDPDRDGLTNEEELAIDTHPRATDTDGDTIGDGTEVAMATDPLDPGSFPVISLTTSHLWITDVTPTSSSVVWISDQPAAGFVNIYSDPDGNDLVMSVEVKDDGAENPPAPDNGVMKVDVSGLQPNTDYYVRIVTISNEGVLVEPAIGELLHKIRTEDSAGNIFSNDVIAHKVLESDGSTPAVGAILIAVVEGAAHPISGWVGAGVPDPKYALVNLQNIYSELDHIGLDLVGGETITLVSIGGSMGYRRFSGEVPVETGGIQTLDPEPDDEFCTLDDVGPVTDTGTLQPADGTFVNDNTPLISASYSDLYSEVDPGSVKLLVDGADVTNEATVDSGTIQFTPNPLLVDGSHSVTLTVADEWGNEADPFTWTFSIDTTDPVVTIIEPVDFDYLYPPTQIVRWSIGEENLTEVTLTLNGNSRTIPLGISEDTVVLAEGVNVIEVAALDIAGNTGTTTVEVNLDEDFDGDNVGNHYDEDDDNDLMPDSWEKTYNLDPFDPYNGYRDSDGDGYADITEYTGGETNPLDPGEIPSVNLSVDHLTVTDVTNEGFSVVWHASEASTCRLVAYDDLGSPQSSANIFSESESHPPAEDNGVMKATANGLESTSTYRFQTVTTSNTTGLVLVNPVYSQALAVVTESTDPTALNDPVKQKIYDEDGNSADGALLVVTVAGGDNPVTAWVDSSLPDPWAQADLNQLYSKDNHEPLELSGGEELTLWSFGGSLGNYINFQRIEAPTGTAQTALPEDVYLDTRLGYYRDLEIDLNIAGVAVYTKEGFTSYSLLNYLADQAGGDPTAIESIRRYNSGTGTWETASWFLGQPAGVDFDIKPGESYLIYMSRTVDDVWFEGFALGAANDLMPGMNLVSLPTPKTGFTYDSYEMLLSLGDENEVASVRRYDATGVWQTTSWFLGSPSGAQFNTTEKEGYLIQMKEAKDQWRPY